MKLFIQHMCPPGETELPNTHKHISALWKVSAQAREIIIVKVFVSNSLVKFWVKSFKIVH